MPSDYLDYQDALFFEKQKEDELKVVLRETIDALNVYAAMFNIMRNTEATTKAINLKNKIEKFI